MNTRGSVTGCTRFGGMGHALELHRAPGHVAKRKKRFPLGKRLAYFTPFISWFLPLDFGSKPFISFHVPTCGMS